jgi:hypothetical protein
MIPFTFDQLRRLIDARRGTTKQDTLARLGEALLFVQNVEAAFRFVMTFVIQKGQEGLDLEKWEAQSKAEREKTIGYFLNQLRFRVDVEPQIDARLSTFLNIRNQMVHRLEEVPGWGLEDEASLRISNDFLTEVFANCFFVYFWLSGVTKSWATQAGFTTQYDDHEIMKIIDEHFVPLAEWALAAKETVPRSD